MKSFAPLKVLAAMLVAGVVSIGLGPASARAEVISDGFLNSASPVTPVGLRPGCAYGLHSVRLVGGATYTIDLTSAQFDAYLILTDTNGTVLAEDDDSGGGLNARITFTAPQTGSYRIYATTFAAGQLGRYRLSVRP
jgi:hypothetical protein